MSRIGDTFARLAGEDRAAFMPFLTCGDPSAEATLELMSAFAEAGVGLIELGMPFSDPLADGPVIQAASTRALTGGMTVAGALGVLRRFRERSAVPVCLMGSYNPALRYGAERFCADAAAAGADGLIIPDLPPEESEGFVALSDSSGLDNVFLVAPTTTPERLALIGGLSRGFIYYISITGVTGARERLAGDIREHVDLIRRRSDLPVAVGFGTKTPEQAAEVAREADGVIVGSAIVSRIAERAGAPDLVESTASFVRSFVEAVALARKA